MSLRPEAFLPARELTSSGKRCLLLDTRGFAASCRIAEGMTQKHLPHIFLAALLVAATSVFIAAANAIPLPAGTPVSVHLVDSISSSGSSQGQTFSIIVAEPAVKQGWVLVQKGANGQGHIVAVNPVGKGHEASIAVQLDWVVSVSGQHVDLAAVKGKTTPLVFGVNGSYASNFQKGKDISVGPDLVFPGYVSADQVVTVNAGP